ncbi:MAG: ABC transporter permease subunit [Clostridiales bacterium]|nr:ABC transporter permease subunit [Clostridiales bacterium]
MARNRLLKPWAVLLALLFWQLLAMIIGNSIVIVGPLDVAKQLIKDVVTPVFWGSILFSFLRIFSGFMVAVILGIALASLSYAYKPMRTLLWPYIAIIKSTPVASTVILMLIIFSSKNLSAFVTFLIVLPVIYSNILQGLISTDVKLIEAAKVFGTGFFKRIKFIYLPQLEPYILSATSASIGMAWKAGTAAEVIGIPKGSIGERLYEAKIYLMTSEVFAWTAVIILASVLFEKIFIWALKFFYKRLWRS